MTSTQLKMKLFAIAVQAIVESNKQNPFIDRREAWRQYNEARKQLCTK